MSLVREGQARVRGGASCSNALREWSQQGRGFGGGGGEPRFLCAEGEEGPGSVENMWNPQPH